MNAGTIKAMLLIALCFFVTLGDEAYAAEATYPKLLAKMPSGPNVILVNGNMEIDGKDSVSCICVFDPQKNTRTPLIAWAWGGVWSPKGWIAFHRMIRNGSLSSLYIVDQQGVLYKITDENTWMDLYPVSFVSTDGDYLAYIVDSLKDGDHPPTALHVFNQKTKANNKVPVVSRYLHWASFDGNLYILKKNNVVVCYDPRTKILSDTKYQSNFFSPNGNYYFEFLLEDPSHLRIRRRSTNEEITYRTDSPIPVGARDYLEAMSWLDNRHLVAYTRQWFRSEKEPARFIIDIESGEIRKTDKYIVGPYQGDEVFAENSSTREISIARISDMEIIKPDEWPKTPPNK